MQTMSTVPVSVRFVSPQAQALYAEGLQPATCASAGTDLRAAFDTETLSIAPHERAAIPTGLCIQPTQAGWAGFVYSRSGLGARDGLTVAQGVGVIDPDYTGEIIVFLLNTSDQLRQIKRGERIAQLIFQSYAAPVFTVVEQLCSTQRGSGGFGHTGR